MNPQKLIKTLIEIGLNEKEAQVYLAAIKLGPTTVIKLADEAGQKRTTTHSVIQTLIKKSLMSVEAKGLKQVYLAEDPERLDMLVQERVNHFHQLLPEYRALYNLSSKGSMIRYYIGEAGIKQAYNQLLAELSWHDFYLVITDYRHWRSRDLDYFDNYITRRAATVKEARILAPDTKVARAYQSKDKINRQETRFMPKETEIHGSTIITPNTLLTMTTAEPLDAIVIQNKNFIDMQKEIFEALWKETELLGEKK